MKNYQKPMVNIEMINVEDVITSSTIELSDDITLTTALEARTTVADGGNATIVFEW